MDPPGGAPSEPTRTSKEISVEDRAQTGFTEKRKFPSKTEHKLDSLKKRKFPSKTEQKAVSLKKKNG
jgi:hypothetical protein